MPAPGSHGSRRAQLRHLAPRAMTFATWGFRASGRSHESLPLWRCCRRIGRRCVQNTPTIRPIRSRKRVCRFFPVHERINRFGVRKIVTFAARTGPQGRHVPLDLADLCAVGNQAQTGTNHARLSTPTPYRWSVRLGCPFPCERGEGNNSPVGAGGATRLTGLDPGARLCW